MCPAASRGPSKYNVPRTAPHRTAPHYMIQWRGGGRRRRRTVRTVRWWWWHNWTLPCSVPRSHNDIQVACDAASKRREEDDACCCATIRTPPSICLLLDSSCRQQQQQQGGNKWQCGAPYNSIWCPVLSCILLLSSYIINMFRSGGGVLCCVVLCGGCDLPLL